MNDIYPLEVFDVINISSGSLNYQCEVADVFRNEVGGCIYELKNLTFLDEPNELVKEVEFPNIGVVTLVSREPAATPEELAATRRSIVEALVKGKTRDATSDGHSLPIENINACLRNETFR